MKRWKKGLRWINRAWDFCVTSFYAVMIVAIVFSTPPAQKLLCAVKSQFLPLSSLPTFCRPEAIAAFQILRQMDLPTEVYQKYPIQGFTIFAIPQTGWQQEILSKALEQLRWDLAKLSRLMPPPQFSALQKVPIWLEFGEIKTEIDRIEQGTAGVYFNSVEWLQRNGYNPDKAGGIGIYDLSDFVQYSPPDQLGLMIHEFAHAYHYQVLGQNDAGIRSAYQQAMKKKLYESVQHISGKEEKAYAAMDQYEYFAELSVSYFGQNYYYPFNRLQLANHDPAGYRLIEKSWRKPIKIR